MTPAFCEHCREELPPRAKFCPDCGKPAVAQLDFATPLPARLAAALGPDYQVLGELGRGGFSIVFSVRDLRLKRYLAVKVMRPELLTAEGAHARFQREAQVVAQLDHPNILPISFAGEGAGLSFFAMPRVSGPSGWRPAYLIDRHGDLFYGEGRRGDIPDTFLQDPESNGYTRLSR